MRAVALILVIACASCARQEQAPSPQDPGVPSPVRLDYRFKTSLQGLAVDFTIANATDVPLRDVRIECVHASASGVRFDSKHLVVEGPIQPHGQVAHEDFVTGFRGFSASPSDKVTCVVQSFRPAAVVDAGEGPVG